MIFGQLWNTSCIVFQFKKALKLILKVVGQKTSLKGGGECV